MRNDSSNRPANRYLSASDAHLIAECLRGVEDAWQALILRYEALVYSALLKSGLKHADADDVFQDVCLLMYNHLSDLRDAKKLSGWLISTSRREAWRFARRKKVTLASELGDGDWEMESAPPITQQETASPHAAVILLEDQQLIREAMQQLKDVCRQLLTLLYMTDPSTPYTEISSRLNIPSGSIGPQRARCLQRLQRALDELGF